MAISADELDRFAQRMGMTSSAAEELIRRLRELNNASDRSASAMDAARDATDRMTRSQQNAASTLSNLGKTTTQVAGKLFTLPGQIAGANGQVFTSITPALTAVSELADAIPGIASAFGGMIGTVGGPLARQIGSVVGKLLGGVSEKTIKTFMSMSSFMLSGAEEVVQSFFALSANGATFSASLGRLDQYVRETGFSLQFLANAARKNAPDFAMLGGTVEGGMMQVLKVTGRLSDELVTVYGGFENLSDEVSEYLTLRRLQGVDDLTRSKNLAESTSNYLYNLKLLSTITGKSTKTLREEVSQRTRSAAAQQMMSEMNENERQNLENQLKMIQDDATRTAYLDYVMSQKFGMAASSTTTVLMAMTGNLEDNFRVMNDAISMQSSAANEITAETYKQMSQNAKIARKESGFLLYGVESGRLTSQVLVNLNNYLTSIGQASQYAESLPNTLKTASEAISTLKSGVEEVKTLTGTVGGILRAQQDLQTTINEFFMGPTFKDGKEIPGGRIQLFGALNEMFTEIFSGLLKKLDTMIKETMSFLSPTATQREIAGGGAAAVDPLRARIEGYQAAIETHTLELQQAKKELQKVTNSLKPVPEKVDQLKTQIEELEAFIRESRKELKKAQELKEQSKPSTTPDKPTGTSEKTSATTDNMGNTSNTFTINWQEFTDSLAPLLSNQNKVITALEDALSVQASQIKRVMDRVG